ncbi:MAG: dephospho-CoA kinase [Micrococcales bacterium]
MYLIGLTGGIASGKSTVAKHWVSLGGHEIDADLLARQAVEPGSKGEREVHEIFGDEVFTDGKLDRAKLGDVVFKDASLRAELEAIIHPLVQELAALEFAKVPRDGIAIYNVPLLVEAKVSLPFDQVVTVEAPIEEQVKRIVATRGLSAEQAMARIRNQATPAQRANAADFILNSNQAIELLLKDAGALWFKFELLAQQKLANGSH